MKGYSFIRIIAIISMVLAITACTKEVPFDPSPGVEENGNVNVTIRVPAAQTVTTRSMSELEECEIAEIDVLVFNSSNDKFLYHEKGYDINEVSNVNNQRTFSTKIKKTADPNNVYLMVYANVNNAIEQALSDGTISTEKSSNDIMKALIFDLPYDTQDGEGGKWLVKPGRYTRFPMWGRSTGVDLTQATITVPAITLLRAVAKIDVGLNFTEDTNNSNQLDNFYLEEYYLYNALNKLQIAPNPENYNAEETRVQNESVPTNATTFTPNDPIIYKRRVYRGDDGYKDFLSEIYMAEHPASKGNTIGNPNEWVPDKNAPCIVIGGRFGADKATALANPITYYRIDFIKTTTNNGVVTAQEFLPILRNYRYKINITEVKGRGYSTAKEAFEAIGLNTNLKVDIVNEDEAITDIAYDGQYMLGVSKKAYRFDANGITDLNYAANLIIRTNLAAGWKASANVSWIHFVQADGKTTGETMSGEIGLKTLKFTLDAYVGTAERTGIITLQAGRIFQIITVVQSNLKAIETSDIYSFYTMDSGTKYFMIKSTFDWRARVINDEYNVMASFPRSGKASATDQPFNFTCIDEIKMQALPEDKRIQDIKIEFYSENDEFTPTIATVKIDGNRAEYAGMYMTVASTAGLGLSYNGAVTACKRISSRCYPYASREPEIYNTSKTSLLAQKSYNINKEQFIYSYQVYKTSATANDSYNGNLYINTSGNIAHAGFVSGGLISAIKSHFDQNKSSANRGVAGIAWRCIIE